MSNNKPLWVQDDPVSFRVGLKPKTHKELPSGVYDILPSPFGGSYWHLKDHNVSELLRLKDNNIDSVVSEIETFWQREEKYKYYGIPFKRGVLLYGPPGGGKTSAAKIIINDVIKSGGVVVDFTRSVNNFEEGLIDFRSVQSETPVVVLMENIDNLMGGGMESYILNLLDGVGFELRKVVYLATTNYPENLSPRIANRPSRFDSKFLIGYPSAESRRIYLEFLFKNAMEDDKPLFTKNWVTDTENLSFAHLKELFTSVVVLGKQYSDVLKTIKGMKVEVKSEDFDDEYDDCDEPKSNGAPPRAVAYNAE